ncbi:[Ribosomal protein S5]-alanine N-acetyltransferase [Phycisphaerales bacterium]|nr:[Ribosomal protein S5]-alanine N-acetyltransferase [Phycisphaerales bacterium]
MPVRAVQGLSRAVQVGERVFLRHPSGADRAEWTKLREASEDHLRPWDPTPPGNDEPLPPDIAFDKLVKSCDTPESQRFVICLVADGRIAGQISLNQIFRGPFQNAVAGYWIGKQFAGKGYMTEALRLALRQAFEKLGLHRVEANIIPRNAPSKALVRGIGLRLEGLAKRYLRIAGAWEDHEHWAITAEEWAALRDRPPRDDRVRPRVSGGRRGGSSGSR